MHRLSIRQLIRLLVLVCLAAAGSFAWAQNRSESIRLRAGESIGLSGDMNGFLRHAATITSNQPGFRLNASGSITASLTLQPGVYNVAFTAVSETGETRIIKAAVVLDPVATVPVGATRPPVILMNGWQLFGLGCLTSTGVSSTFGNTLEPDLKNDGVPVVYHFDVCVEGPSSKIEELGNTLAQVIGLIHYSDGRPIDQVDLVAHSMGGLVFRSYLAGVQTDGSLKPPANHRVRKAIQIATPNFGSFLAIPNSDAQSAEMVPGSTFLWNLATWNQRTDDLRGVDAVAIIGNLGHKPLTGGSYPPAKASDGVVSLTSASLSFAVADAARTRVLPYCHTDFSLIEQAVVDCQGAGIAKAPETEAIVRDFLSDNESWRSIGTSAASDAVLSKSAGVFFEAFNANNQPFTDLSAVTFGSVVLTANSNIFTQDLVAGPAAFSATSKSLGSFNCGTVTPAVGYYSMFRCKPAPVIQSVSPLVPNTGALLVESGGPIVLSGAGFGSPTCTGCRLSAGSTTLAVTAWSDQSITAQLPTSFTGLTTLTLQTAAGLDTITFMAAPQAAPVVLSVSPLNIQFAGGGSQPISIGNSGGGGSIPWTAQASVSWIALSGTSGATPATLTASVNPSGVAPGSYSGQILITSPGAGVSVTVTVTLTISGGSSGGSPAISSVIHAASLAEGPVAPREIVLISGTNLHGSVTFSGTPATILYQSPSQIVAVAPTQISSLDTAIISVADTTISVPVVKTNPGIFNLGGQAIALNEDGTWNGPSHPATLGATITLYITGGGLTSPAGTFEAAVSATVGGVPATVFTASAATAYAPGVGQISLQLPVVISPGAANVQVQIGGVSSPAPVTVFVQ